MTKIEDAIVWKQLEEIELLAFIQALGFATMRESARPVHEILAFLLDNGLDLRPV